jgi:hypothetical protein
MTAGSRTLPKSIMVFGDKVPLYSCSITVIHVSLPGAAGGSAAMRVTISSLVMHPLVVPPMFVWYEN